MEVASRSCHECPETFNSFVNVLLTTNKDVMYYFHHDRFHDMLTDAKTQFLEEKVFLTSTYFIHKKRFLNVYRMLFNKKTLIFGFSKVFPLLASFSFI